MKINDEKLAENALKALALILVPVVDFVIDSGLSAQDIYFTLREAAVRNVAARQIYSGQRMNISGIAASTGITRAEVARVLRSNHLPYKKNQSRKDKSTNRVLKKWHHDPEFKTPEGEPANLRIYGTGATFETLVKKCGGGIPTRATLDELIRVGAVAVASSGTVRAMKSVAFERHLTPRDALLFGVRAAKLLSTILTEVRDPRRRIDFEIFSGLLKSPSQSSLFRTTLLRKGGRVLRSICDSVYREMQIENLKCRKVKSRRVNVTISLRNRSSQNSRHKVIQRRRNLRRDYGE